MKTILDLIVEELKPAFTGCGYDEKYIRVTVSNRPDLCEYQCNGAMAAAKAYKKKPIDIANEVVEKTAGSKMFSEINAVMPGFINIRLNPCYLASYVQQVAEDEKLGLNAAKKPETIIIDYGGANVAKHCMSDTYVPRSSERASSASAAIWDTMSSAMCIWVTGDCRWD